MTNPEKVSSMIAATNGRLFTVKFTKRDGTERTMTARTGVRKHLTGKGMAYNPKARGLVPVFEFGKKDYRMVNTATVSSFRCGKVRWSE